MSTSPQKNDIVTQEIAHHNNIDTTDDDENKSRLYQLGVLCASPGLTKDNLTKEMLSNLDKSNAIKNDQRTIISNIHGNEGNKSAPNTKVPQTISSQTSTGPSSTTSSTISSTTSSRFNSSSRGSISLKRNRIPPPLNLSSNKKSHKGDVGTSNTPQRRPNSNNRLKYFSRSGNNNSNSNNNNNNNSAKSAPPNILHFPGRNSKSHSILQEKPVTNKNTRKEHSQTYANLPPDPSMYPYYSYPTNISPAHMMAIPSATESNPHFYNPYAYPSHPPPGYMIPYPYMFPSPPYSNASTAVEEQTEEPTNNYPAKYFGSYLGNYPVNNSGNYPGNYPGNNSGNYPGNYPTNYPVINSDTYQEEQVESKQQDTITGDIRIMNNVFTFEFPHNEALDKDTFSSICNKIWNEHIELSRK
ncbi:hypothetical protein MOSE0_L06546 [Monosporozyma servazzii]